MNENIQVKAFTLQVDGVYMRYVLPKVASMPPRLSSVEMESWLIGEASRQGVDAVPSGKVSDVPAFPTYEGPVDFKDREETN